MNEWMDEEEVTQKGLTCGRRRVHPVQSSWGNTFIHSSFSLASLKRHKRNMKQIIPNVVITVQTFNNAVDSTSL